MFFKKSEEKKPIPVALTIGRNDLCHCGSKKKYKKCCEEKDSAKEHAAIEKQWTQAEKDFEKLKKEAEKAAPAEHATTHTPKSGSPTVQAKEQRHSSIPAPKFNMPRRTGGG